MINSDAFVFSPNSGSTTLYAKRIVGTSLTSLDIPALVADTATKVNCSARIVMCCSAANSSSALTCANSPLGGANTIVAVEVLGSSTSCQWTTSASWTAVDAVMLFTGKTASTSTIDMAVTTATSATAGWVLAVIVVVVILIIVGCCWRKKAMRAANTVDGPARRRELPQLRRDAAYAEVPRAHAEVPRPGTELHRRRDDDAQAHAQALSERGHTSTSVDDVEMRHVQQLSTRSQYGRSRAQPLPETRPSSFREEDPAATWGSVVPSTSLFGGGSSHPNSPAPAAPKNAQKGDDFWAA
ncbi:transmembrane protein, putative [Bodo saltans]|uniref:Transmembrane protein, putative n=1 Tax=Bodo saltans TaxID=75058 RepID=A0A0S4KM05_BODSA|nr:transmembrane protein, putative [Bodo saltans]|eukprot:CUI15447.1 transmembrane protein, putative [Bodo saltans]